MKFHFKDSLGHRYSFTFQHPGLVDVQVKFEHPKMGPTLTTAWPHKIEGEKIEDKEDYGGFPFSQEARDYVNKLVRMKAFL